MAVSTLTVAPSPPKPHLLYQTINPMLSSFNFKPSSSSSSTTTTTACCNGVSNFSPQPVSATKRGIVDVGIGLLAASILAFTPLDANATRIEYYATVSDPPCEMTFAPSGLGYCDIAPGTGPEPPLAQLIVIHYTARFADGTVFDSSYKRARPLTLRIGVSKVIRGLDQGIIGGEGVPPMLEGGKRKIRIPPQLAYGPEPAGCFSGDCNIPANATLVYDINYIGPYK